MSPEIKLIYKNILKYRIQTRVFRSRANHNYYKVTFDHMKIRIGERTAVYLCPQGITQSAAANFYGNWEEIT
jgi:hypothetical protein